MSEPSAAVEPRKRKRTVQDGRIITNVDPCFGHFIWRESEDLGVAGATVAKMLIVEAIKARGWTKEKLLAAMAVDGDTNVGLLESLSEAS